MVEWYRHSFNLGRMMEETAAFISALVDPQHQAELVRHNEQPLDCAQCHTPAGATRMTVVRADAPVCLSCHAHQARDHYVDAECAQCHVPFVESELPPLQLTTLPVPEDHRIRDFILDHHGELAGADITRCAVCHTRERCESCHAGDRREAPEIVAGYNNRDYIRAFLIYPRAQRFFGLTEIDGALDAIAKGDLTHTIERHYAGRFGRLKNSCNRVVDQLSDRGRLLIPIGTERSLAAHDARQPRARAGARHHRLHGP